MNIKDDIEKLGTELKVARKAQDYEKISKLRGNLNKIANSFERKADLIDDDNDPVKKEAYEIAYWALEAAGNLDRVISVCRKANRIYSAAAAAGRFDRPTRAIALYDEMGWQDCGARVARQNNWPVLEKDMFIEAIEKHEKNGWYAGAGDLAEEAGMVLKAIENYSTAAREYEMKAKHFKLDGKPVEAKHYRDLAASTKKHKKALFAKSG